VSAQDLVSVHMAKRPILITARRELLDGARRVSVVRRPARAGSMQHADVEPAGKRGRVGERVIFGDDPVRKAAAMQHDLEILEPEALGGAAWKFAHIRRQGDALRHHAFGIVIALEEEDADPGAIEPCQFAIEEEADRGIAPFPLIDVAGDHDEGDLLGKRRIDEGAEGLAARSGEAARELLILERKPLEKAPEMQVGGMQESEFRHLVFVESPRTASILRLRALNLRAARKSQDRPPTDKAPQAAYHGCGSHGPNSAGGESHSLVPATRIRLPLRPRSPLPNRHG